MKRRVFFRSTRIGMCVLPIAIFTSMFEFALPLKIESIESNLSLVGIFISLSWLATTFLDLLFGDITDRIGKKKASIIGIAAFAVFAAGFAFTNNFWLLFLLNMAAYLGFDLFFIAIQGYLVSTSPKKYFNYASSGFYPFWSFGFVLGPLISAFLILNIHSNWVYLLAPVFGIATIIFINFLKEKAPVSKVPHKRTEIISRKNFAEFLEYFRKIFRKDFWLLAGTMACTFWYSAMVIGIPLLFLIEEHNIWLSAFVMAAFVIPFVVTDSLI